MIPYWWGKANSSTQEKDRAFRHDQKSRSSQTQEREVVNLCCLDLPSMPVRVQVFEDKCSR
jgi:hypothetical protein